MQNTKELEENLDLLEERRADVKIRATASKRKTEQYFNRRIRARSFKVGDVVIKGAGVTTAAEGKLGP